MITNNPPGLRTPGLGERIASRRQELGLTQQEVARAARVDKAVITRLEQGISRTSRYLHRIANALSVPIAFLTDGESPKSLDWQPYNTNRMITPALGNVPSHQEEIILLDLIDQSKGSPTVRAPATRIPFPRALLPAGGDLAILALRPSVHVVIDRSAPIEDGQAYAVCFQDSNFVATIYLDADGFTLRRDGHTSRIPRYEHGANFEVLGRVILSLNRSDL